ncbi:hypothetical protein CKO44_22430 [Rubrivivax gelatinosus]|uniref:tripartite tricarboxylate transporter substrate binding protein n=1 Tax=Rubrivivax gelatinosus TaxID=28068 RepID=UPI001903B43D|nr:tripartite tricarboxylate transporter substrate binding protein [Rubrivivax gelatinosus]MBK1616215.1 hypothetical protein [Rubrivivax gelatinosus]
MQHPSRRGFLAVAALAAASPLARAATGKPVRLVVPYPAGGVVDVAARIVADEIGTRTGQAFVVENKAGANGNLGAQAVKAAAADGQTVLVGSLFVVLNPLIDRHASFATRDFEPLAEIGAPPNLIVVPASSPLRTLAELLALARRQPGRLNTPNPGTGSSNHLGLELLIQASGIEVAQVPYKGQPPFVVDLVNGELHFAFMTAALALPQIRSGALRPLAVASHHRLDALPELPTLAEAGYADAVVLPWNGWFVPAGTPRAAGEHLAAEVETALRSAEVQRRFGVIGAELPKAPRRFPAFVAAEAERWKLLVAERRIKLDEG